MDVRCLAQGHHGRAGGELGPLQVEVHTPYLGLVGNLNRRPYGSQSKPLLLLDAPLPAPTPPFLWFFLLMHCFVGSILGYFNLSLWTI